MGIGIMKAPFWNQLSPRRRKVVLWILGLVLFYAVMGFLILPPIVRAVAVKQLSKQLDREVSIESVKINPFVLSTTIRDLLIKDKDGQPFVSWDEVYVNFQLSSFFGHAWVFKEISTTKPFVRAQMNKDYTFNFSDIIAKFSSNAPASTAPSKPIAVHVNRLRIKGASAAVADFTPREPFKRVVGPLDITLDDFRTDPDNKNPYSFIGTTDAGEIISWSGFFYLNPLRSKGELKLFNFNLTKYAPLYQDLVRFQIRDGSIALVLKYRLEISATNRVTAVDDLAYSLRDFKLGAPDQSNNIVELPLLSVTGASADLQSRTATVNSILVDGARAFVSRDANAAVNVIELSKPAEDMTNAPGGILFLLRSVTNAVAMLLNSTNQWTGMVRDITVTNCALHLEDHAVPRSAHLDLSDITVQAKNISNLPGTNMEAAVSVRWNTNAAIHVAASGTFQPTSADVKIDLDHLDLTTLDAYLADKLNLFILGSDINLHGTVSLRPQTNDLPVVSFTGDASLEKFHTVDGMFGEDLLKWDAVRFLGMDANLNPPVVAIREIAIENAYARVIVETNRTINLLNVLKPGGPEASATNETQTVAATTKTATAPTAPAGSFQLTNLPAQISIGAITITNTALDYSDRSIQPNVHMVIASVNGSVSDLSTERLQHARVNLNAVVNGAGPATITGNINPLNGAETNDIKVLVKDVDITPTSPYSGKFAGYGISEGKLNLDLEYHLVGKKLASKNVITLDQFTFGEKVNSPDATHLPVRLAIAILKDRDGKIVLDVPIEGSLDDPKFRIGKVVTRAIVNILEKVATSPFSLIGAAFGGGGEELGYQDFAPGDSQLTAEDKKKLDSLAKALYARPALKLEIAGSIDPDGDHDGLQRVALDRDIRTRKWMSLKKREQATNSVNQIVISADDRQHYIEKLYDEAVAAQKITPDFIAAHTNLASYAAVALARAGSVKKGGELLTSRAIAVSANSTNRPPTRLSPPPSPLEAVLMATYPVTDADFQALAASRAQAVQAYLVQVGKVEPGRIFITAGEAEHLRRDGSRTYLQFQ